MSNHTRPESTAAIARATKKSWAEWLKHFEEAGAISLPHREIARIARASMPDDLKNPDWWAQATAIAYEQAAGLRLPGQSSTGDYRAGASRTLPMTRDEAFSRWLERWGDVTEHRGHEVTNVRQSITAKRSFWRATLDGAGKLAVSVESKGEDRALVGLDLTALGDPDLIEPWRAHLKHCLDEM